LKPFTLKIFAVDPVIVSSTTDLLAYYDTWESMTSGPPGLGKYVPYGPPGRRFYSAVNITGAIPQLVLNVAATSADFHGGTRNANVTFETGSRFMTTSRINRRGDFAEAVGHVNGSAYLYDSVYIHGEVDNSTVDSTYPTPTIGGFLNHVDIGSELITEATSFSDTPALSQSVQTWVPGAGATKVLNSDFFNFTGNWTSASLDYYALPLPYQQTTLDYGEGKNGASLSFQAPPGTSFLVLNGTVDGLGSDYTVELDPPLNTTYPALFDVTDPIPWSFSSNSRRPFQTNALLFSSPLEPSVNYTVRITQIPDKNRTDGLDSTLGVESVTFWFVNEKAMTNAKTQFSTFTPPSIEAPNFDPPPRVSPEFIAAVVVSKRAVPLLSPNVLLTLCARLDRSSPSSFSWVLGPGSTDVASVAGSNCHGHVPCTTRPRRAPR